MDALVRLIIHERDSSRIEEISRLLANFSENETKLFKSNYEKSLKTLPEAEKRKSQEYFKEILVAIERVKRDQDKKSSEEHKRTPFFKNSEVINSASNSPEKQNSNTRWSISREERKRILELMERGRDEQKRRKKKNWCQSDFDEFEELWKGIRNGLTERDLEIIKSDEGIPIEKDNAVVKANTKDLSNKRIKTSSTTLNSNTATYNSDSNLAIVDFDCIEDLLVLLARSKNVSISESARFLLNTADEIYRSGLTFYTDLKEFDQPNFDFYLQEDDQVGLKNYRFETDDLGRFSRGKSFNDKSKKFYRERAYRFRYMSRKPYDLFFSSRETFKKLKGEVENLKQNSEEFSFWISAAVAKRNVCFISHRPLLKAFALFLVISRTVALSTAEITELLWSCRKMGSKWTLEEVLRLKMRSKSACLLTHNKDSEIAREATKFKDIIKIL